MKKIYFLPLLYLIFLSPGMHGQEPVRAILSVSYPDSVITWKFDSQGDSALNAKMNYRYDSHLHMIESEKFTREQSLQLWVPSRKVLWEFDNQDNLILWAIYEWDNNAMAYKGFIKETTEFDSHGNKAEYHYYTWNYSLFDWGNRFWDLFDYDNENKITRGDHLEWNTDYEHWDTASYDIYEYGSEGFLQHLTIWEPDEDLGGNIYPNERSDYLYDGSGNVIELIRQIYNPNTGLWYYTVRFHYWYDSDDRKIKGIYAEYQESEEIWLEKEKDEWGWDDSDSLILYAYYRIGEDLLTWYPDLKAEMAYNSHGKLIHYRGYSGNDQAQWVPTYERRYPYQNDTLLMADSLFQWIENDQVWKFVDCHNYQYDSLPRMHTDSYYKFVVHTGLYELSTRDYYFYSAAAGIEDQGGGEAWGHESLGVWPNPTRRVFSLQSAVSSQQSVVAELIDIYGNLLAILSCELQTANYELDISPFPAGIYFVRIYFDNQVIVKKVIKL